MCDVDAVKGRGTSQDAKRDRRARDEETMICSQSNCRNLTDGMTQQGILILFPALLAELRRVQYAEQETLRMEGLLTHKAFA